MPPSTDLRDLLAGPVLDVAPRLLGSVLRHGEVACRITEVEAYDGAARPRLPRLPRADRRATR